MQGMLVRAKPLNLDKYYSQADRLIRFGETFKCIDTARRMNDEELVGMVTTPADEQYFSFTLKAYSFISPVTIDNIGRFMLLSEYQKNGGAIVPVYIKSAKKYADFVEGESLYVYCRLISQKQDNVVYSAQVTNKNNKLVFTIEDMELSRIARETGDHNL